MPRQARQKCESNIYHIMARGINQVQLFYDDEDRSSFLKRLVRYKQECQIKIFAWCLMGNHFHFLAQHGDFPLSTFMKKILLSYSHYYNRRYDRQGYLYQGRFVSKPIDSDSYFLAAIRYIHRNPLEAGNPITFWTSFNEYLHSASIVTTDMALGMLSDDRIEAITAFRGLVTSETTDLPDWSISAKTHLMDAEAIAAIKDVAGVSECGELSSFDSNAKTAIIISLRNRGLSVRQIARLTGLSKTIVEAARPL